jgi:hypothetical protein
MVIVFDTVAGEPAEKVIETVPGSALIVAAAGGAGFTVTDVI